MPVIAGLLSLARCIQSSECFRVPCHTPGREEVPPGGVGVLARAQLVERLASFLDDREGERPCP